MNKILCTGAPRSGTSMLNLLMSYFKDAKVFMNGTPPRLWDECDIFTTQQRPDGKIWNDYIQQPKSVVDFADDGVKVVYIYRDGRDCLISKRAGHPDYWYGPDLNQVEKWFRSIEEILPVMADTHENIHIVKYEDLVSNHEEEIPKIEEFVGMKISDDYVNFYKDFANKHNMSTEGAIGTDHSGLRPLSPNSGNWKKDKHKKRMMDIVSNYNDLEDLLIELGYEEDKKWIDDVIEPITFVIPSRNNLDLLKLSYDSIRKLKGNHHVLVLDDASEDGTGDWLALKADNYDDNLHIYTNPGPHRVGIVGMFDKGIEMAPTDIIFAFHADMVAAKHLDVNTLKHLSEKTVVCSTRIEPPLHPEGPEKIIHDYGVEPKDFKMKEWMDECESFMKDSVTSGVFAPWCMYKEDFISVGGHDVLFSPQSREDSDLFNRFLLSGYKLKQSWDSLVYHFTSRGSRFNKHSGGDIGKDSPEWQLTNMKNMRNFYRKWGTMVQHDEYMKPIISPMYDIGFYLKGDVNTEHLRVLEPLCSTIYVEDEKVVNDYVMEEQPLTLLNLKERVKHIYKKENDIVVEFNVRDITQQSMYILENLNKIISDSAEVGKMELDIFKFDISKMKELDNNRVLVKE